MALYDSFLSKVENYKQDFSSEEINNLISAIHDETGNDEVLLVVNALILEHANRNKVKFSESKLPFSGTEFPSGGITYNSDNLDATIQTILHIYLKSLMK